MIDAVGKALDSILGKAFSEFINNTLAERIAEEGLSLLVKILLESPNVDPKLLLDYDIGLELQPGAADSPSRILFNIDLKVENMSDYSIGQIKDDRSGRVFKKKTEREEIRSKAKRWSWKWDEMRPVRASYQRDARSKYHDARKPIPDIRQTSQKRKTFVTSRDRLVQHEFHSIYPRGFEFDPDGLVDLDFKRTMKSTRTTFQYPAYLYEGAIKKLIDGIQYIIETEFIPLFYTRLSELGL